MCYIALKNWTNYKRGFILKIKKEFEDSEKLLNLEVARKALEIKIKHDDNILLLRKKF